MMPSAAVAGAHRAPTETRRRTSSTRRSTSAPHARAPRHPGRPRSPHRGAARISWTKIRRRILIAVADRAHPQEPPGHRDEIEVGLRYYTLSLLETCRTQPRRHPRDAGARRARRAGARSSAWAPGSAATTTATLRSPTTRPATRPTARPGTILRTTKQLHALEHELSLSDRLLQVSVDLVAGQPRPQRRPQRVRRALPPRRPRIRGRVAATAITGWATAVEGDWSMRTSPTRGRRDAPTSTSSSPPCAHQTRSSPTTASRHPARHRRLRLPPVLADLRQNSESSRTSSPNCSHVRGHDDYAAAGGSRVELLDEGAASAAPLIPRGVAPR